MIIGIRSDMFFELRAKTYVKFFELVFRRKNVRDTAAGFTGHLRGVTKQIAPCSKSAFVFLLSFDTHNKKG